MGSVPPPIGGESHAHHPRDHDDGGLTDIELRVRALESLMIEKGYVDPAALDAIVETYETRIGPRNGARVVARSWADLSFRRWLGDDATAAIQSLGYSGRQGEHMTAVENTAEVHNLVVCTLCSCYPWPVLGLPPVWYKSAPYRSRAIIDPRGVLAEFGVQLPASTKIRVWDSTAEMRYLVVPMRPHGTEGWSEERLAALVTRDSMVGAGLARDPESLTGAPAA
jgi:nitrile hydratase subunit alpha